MKSGGFLNIILKLVALKASVKHGVVIIFYRPVMERN